MYEILDECWEDGFMSEPMNTIDLTTDDGFSALQQHASHAAYVRYGTPDAPGWERMAGRTLDDLANELATDFLQESVSLPRGAFADPAQAGRELAIVKRVYAFIARNSLRYHLDFALRAGDPLPSGNVQQQAPAHPQPGRKRK